MIGFNSPKEFVTLPGELSGPELRPCGGVLHVVACTEVSRAQTEESRPLPERRVRLNWLRSVWFVRELWPEMTKGHHVATKERLAAMERPPFGPSALE